MRATNIGASAIYIFFQYESQTHCFRSMERKDIETRVGKFMAIYKGAFNIYVNRILTFFDHLPTPSKQT